MKIVIDIETIPCSEETRTVFGFTEETRYRATALDANYGRVCCIGFLVLEESGEASRFTAFYGDSEKNLLDAFWKSVRSLSSPQIITYNGLGFDLPFLWRRSVIQNSRPSIELRLSRFRTDLVYDVMAVWANWELRSSLKLEKLAAVLQMEGKSGKGGQVFEMWRAGKWRDIAEYCLDDVYVTYVCYSRLTFSPYMPKTRLQKELLQVP